jgi:hypothetical protein
MKYIVREHAVSQHPFLGVTRKDDHGGNKNVAHGEEAYAIGQWIFMHIASSF